MGKSLAYRIAVLCYMFDRQGRVLLLYRSNPPNQNLYSPVGGKLNQTVGESPTSCAVREIMEETGLAVRAPDLHLCGLVSEAGYDDQTHWLMFLFEVLCPVDAPLRATSEGTLQWHEPDAIKTLAIPETDRKVIWPLFWRYRKKFFAVHIDCQGGIIRWRIEQPADDARTADKASLD